MRKTFFLTLLAFTIVGLSASAQEYPQPSCPNGVLVYKNGEFVCEIDLNTNYGQIVQGSHPYELNSKAAK